MKKEIKPVRQMTVAGKRTYLRPMCECFQVEENEFICTSVYPQAPQSEEEEWDQDDEVPGGEWEL